MNISSWPAVRYVTRSWPPPCALSDPLWSKQRRRANPGSFKQAVVPKIAATPVDLPAELIANVQEATDDLTRFDAQYHHGVSLEAVLLRSESAASSQLGRLTANARRIALARLGDRSHPNATLIARNIQALEAALRLADHLNSESILAMHEALMADSTPSAGMFRTAQNWIRGDSPVTAMYVPPSDTAVLPAIHDLVQFMQRRDIPALVQAAIAHAQFETIHPFTAGNGRTGRALVSAILRARGTTVNFTVPLSSGLLTRTNEYFEALTAYREGTVVPIIEAFVDATRRAMTNVQVLMHDIVQLRERILKTAARRTRNLHRLAEMCTTEPAFTAQMVHNQGIPQSTVYKLLGRLEQAEILKVERKIRGQQVWSVIRLTAALDAFARRAGRRRPTSES